jgi:hypothetical protein
MQASHLLSVLLLVFIASCGGKNSGSSGSDSNNLVNQNETMMPDGSNVQGIYATDLWPQNFNLHLKKVGVAAVERNGDEFKALVKMDNGSKGTQMRQAIYYGRRCPNINDDLNHDAYIDIQEARIAIGMITIPLDANLDSQERGSREFPVGSSSRGSFNYHKTASFSRMFADLKEPDQDFSDDITKLLPQDGLTLPGRVVLVQGVSSDTILPGTVAGQNGMSAHESIPMGCGIIWKVTSLPEELNH